MKPKIMLGVILALLLASAFVQATTFYGKSKLDVYGYRNYDGKSLGEKNRELLYASNKETTAEGKPKYIPYADLQRIQDEYREKNIALKKSTTIHSYKWVCMPSVYGKTFCYWKVS